MLSPNILWKFLHADVHYLRRRCLCIRDIPSLRYHEKHKRLSVKQGTAMKTCGGSMATLTLNPNEGKSSCSVSRPGYFRPGKVPLKSTE